MEEEPWQVLRDDWDFDEDLARTCQETGVAKALIKLDAEGFKISEGDPLLFVVYDASDTNAVGYVNSGNYGLAAGQPGGIPWPGGAAPAVGAPLPAGVAAAPPNALASFLRGLPDIVDKSDGNMGLVFYVPNLGLLHEMPPRLQQEDQFIRKGPVVAGLMGIPVENALVSFYTLDGMRKPPHAYPHFNQTA